MGVITKTYTFSTGATIVAAEHNSNFDTIYNAFNGSIDDANISATAAIADTKLDQITTAGKVSGTSLTLLGNIPSAAGIIPVAHIPTGTANNQVVKLVAAAALPVLTATNLQNLNAANISTGYVPPERLGSGTPSATLYLNGASTWTNLSALSNVIYNQGFTPTLQNGGTSYATISNFRWVKLSGATSVRLHTMLQSLGGGFSTATCLVAIGSLSATAVTSSDTMAWVTSTNLSISSLTDGTAYNGVVMLKNSGANITSTCQAVTVISSN